jgi:hypothetical protein
MAKLSLARSRRALIVEGEKESENGAARLG